MRRRRHEASAFCLAMTSFAAGTASRAMAQERPREDRASIVLVGRDPGMAELGDRVAELLVREDVRARLVPESDFDPAALPSSSDESSDSVWAFVVPKDRNEVRLYFRDPHARRFLLRQVTLRDGLDEYGREIVAQVVESSIVSLLHSTEGIPPEQAPSEPTTRQVAEPPHVEVPPSPPAPPRAGQPAAFGSWIALRYGYAWAGADLGAPQGPGLAAGLEWRAFGVWISAERFFPQSMTTSQLDASVQTTAFRGTWDRALFLGGSNALLVGLGAGVDVLETRVLQVHDPGLTPSSPSVRVLPVLRPEIAITHRLGPWRVTAAAFTDIDLAADYYQVERRDGSSRVATPWPVRPGAALMIGWSPPPPWSR